MKGKIVVNQEVLLPEYLPDKLSFREVEYRELSASVRNRISVFVVGPVGSGKSSLVKLLQRETGAERFRYVDCLIHDTEYAVLKEVVPMMRAAFLSSTFELIEELRRLSRKIRLTVCLDNFVRLERMDVVEKLTALGLTIILVSGVERDLQLLPANAAPKPPRVPTLRDYADQETYGILRERAQEGLVKSSFEDSYWASSSARPTGTSHWESTF